MSKRPFSQALVEGTAARLAGDVSRRRFLSRTALVGSALAVAPGRFLFRPTTAYAATINTVCGPASDCASGYTVFCCTINNGLNECPPGSFAGGWWRADGSSWCCGGSRYIIDCQSKCTACGCASGTSICPNSCQNCSATCNSGDPTCDRRRICTNRFRYGQCNQQIGCSGNVLCRMVTCTPPWRIPSLACSSSPTLTDHNTAGHGAPCLQRGSWQGGAAPIRPEAVVASSPSVAGVRGSTRRDVFVLGAGGDVLWSSRASQSWSAWRSLGAPRVGVVGRPAGVSWAPGRLDLFARGGDDKLWQRFSTDGGASWSIWFQPLGTDGTLASSPHVVSWASGRLDVFVLGTDGGIWTRTYASGWSPGWRGLGAPAAGVVGEPVAASWAAGRLDLFVRGADSRLYQRFYANGWSPWIQPPGTERGVLTSPPAAASWGRDHVAVFARGPDGGLYWTNYFQAYWSGWARLGNPHDVFQGNPTAGSGGCQQLDVFVRGTNDVCYQYRYSG